MPDHASSLLIIADDSTAPVTTLGSYLDTLPIADLTWRWCDRLTEVWDALSDGAYTRHVVLLDAQMTLLGLEDEVEAMLRERDDGLLRFVEEPVLSGLLFAGLARKLRADARVILHSAYNEPINAFVEANADLQAYAKTVIDRWLWKPAVWGEVLDEIRLGLPTACGCADDCPGRAEGECLCSGPSEARA